MRYCGTCGAQLDVAASLTGRCTICGHELEDPNAATPEDGHASRLWPVSRRQWGRRDARKALGWYPGGIILGALLLFALVSYVLLRGGFANVFAPSAAANGTQPPQASTSTPVLSGVHTPTRTTEAAGATATTAGQTPSENSPTPTGSPTATGAPTEAIIPPSLTANPTNIPITLCVAAQAQVTVANSGGAPFSWSASASVIGYKLSPTSGALDSGTQQTVTVSNISKSGTVTFTAQNARNSPQLVTITCTI